jgi:hypothetical protein
MPASPTPPLPLKSSLSRRIPRNKKLQKEFDLLEAVINIGIQCINDCIEEQYIKELNKENFGYTNCSIKTILNHLRSNWCKVMTLS